MYKITKITKINNKYYILNNCKKLNKYFDKFISYNEFNDLTVKNNLNNFEYNSNFIKYYDLIFNMHKNMYEIHINLLKNNEYNKLKNILNEYNNLLFIENKFMINNFDKKYGQKYYVEKYYPYFYNGEYNNYLYIYDNKKLYYHYFIKFEFKLKYFKCNNINKYKIKYENINEQTEKLSNKINVIKNNIKNEINYILSK